MAALAWIVRILALAVIARMVLRLLFGHRRRPGRTAPRRVERTGGTLVRDPNCGTHIPREGALTARHGSTTHYFCSEACRNAFAASGVRQARTG